MRFWSKTLKWWWCIFQEWGVHNVTYQDSCWLQSYGGKENSRCPLLLTCALRVVFKVNKTILCKIFVLIWGNLILSYVRNRSWVYIILLNSPNSCNNLQIRHHWNKNFFPNILTRFLQLQIILQNYHMTWPNMRSYIITSHHFGK